MNSAPPPIACPSTRHSCVVGTASAVERIRKTATALTTAEWVTSLGALSQRQNGTPQLIVIALEHPDQFAQPEVDALLSSLPLARIICCASEWNASLHRSRPRWPVASTVALTGLESRLRFESEVLQGSATPIPATAGREEAAFAFLPPLPALATSSVAILSPDVQFSRLLCDALHSIDCVEPISKLASGGHKPPDGSHFVNVTNHQKGYLQPALISPLSSARWLLLDLDPGTESQIVEFANLRNEFAGRIIGLTGDPIPSEAPGAPYCDQVCSKTEPLSSWLEALSTSSQAD